MEPSVLDRLADWVRQHHDTLTAMRPDWALLLARHEVSKLIAPAELQAAFMTVWRERQDMTKQIGSPAVTGRSRNSDRPYAVKQGRRVA